MNEGKKGGLNQITARGYGGGKLKYTGGRNPHIVPPLKRPSRRGGNVISTWKRGNLGGKKEDSEGKVLIQVDLITRSSGKEAFLPNTERVRWWGAGAGGTGCGYGGRGEGPRRSFQTSRPASHSLQGVSAGRLFRWEKRKPGNNSNL